MDTALTIYSNAQCMFVVQHCRGNTLMGASCTDIPDTRDTGVASYQDSTGVCEDGNCSHQVAHEKLLP